MTVEVFDLLKIAHEEGKRKLFFNTERLHAWVYVYPNTGDKDDMHCHNADQTFCVLDGECTMVHGKNKGAADCRIEMAA